MCEKKNLKIKITRKEELQKIIDDAENEILSLEIPIEIEEIEETIKSAADYEYWRGHSRFWINLFTGKLLPSNGRCGKTDYWVLLSHCEMDSSKERNLRIVRCWQQKPIIERGEVTHFRKVNEMEKRYTYDWQVIEWIIL